MRSSAFFASDVSECAANVLVASEGFDTREFIAAVIDELRKLMPPQEPVATGECQRCGFDTFGVNPDLCGDCDYDAGKDERAMGL